MITTDLSDALETTVRARINAAVGELTKHLSVANSYLVGDEPKG